MSNLFKQLMYVAALWLPLSALGADAPPPETSQQSKIVFFRNSENIAFPTTRIDVNGQRLDDIGKDGTTKLLIDPGLALVTVDAALTPGQFKFSFTAEKGAEYRFEIFNSMEKQDADHLFGVPPKVANGKIMENGGSLKSTLVSANLPKPVEPEPAPVSKPAKVEPAPDTAPMMKAPLTIEDQLRALKHLYDQELISKEAYIEKQQKILDELK
jgi:hypothetical protein